MSNLIKVKEFSISAYKDINLNASSNIIVECECELCLNYYKKIKK